jgi:hypothetical protein
MNTEAQTVTIKAKDAKIIMRLVEEFYLKGELSPEETTAFLNLCSAGDFGRPVRL